jgi:hypothetical protein
MSKLTSLFLIIIFFVFLTLGIIIGGIVKPPPEETITPSLPEPTNGTTVLFTALVLGVNNFEDENIYLKSAWVATISSISDFEGNRIEAFLVGVYPMSPEQVTTQSQRQYIVPHPPIELPKSYLDNLFDTEILKTVPVLNRTDIFYEDVVVLDEYGMNYIIELTNLNPQFPPPLAAFTNPWENPEHAHDIQHNILESICDPPQNILQYTNFTRVFDIMPDHIVSTSSQLEIESLWQVNINLNEPPTITCNIH